jgi:hypothetical protein
MSSTPTPINYGKIIILIIIVGGFVTGLVLLRNTLNKSCSSGDVYDGKLKKCVIDCSSVPNTRYDSDKDKCVVNCVAPQTPCGSNCMDGSTQHCLGPNNDIICNLTEDICNNVCYNTSLQTCVNNVIYPKNKVCNNDITNPVICTTNQQCSYDNKTCLDCPDDHTVCPYTNNCCPPGTFCDHNGNCSNCNSNQNKCGDSCCNINTNEKCTTHTKKCKVCSVDLCDDGETCCENGYVCVTGSLDGCCNESRVYTNKNGITQCCSTDLCANGECCDSIPGGSCVNGKCMIQCPNPSRNDAKPVYCIPGLEQCIQTNEKTPFYCATLGCEWSELNYDAPNMITNEGSKPICKSGDGKLYMSVQPNMTALSRQSIDIQSPKSTSGIDCNANDCIGRLTEYGITSTDFSKAPQCIGTFDCEKILRPTMNNCPFDDQGRCCSANGQLTGQVCHEDEVCDNGVCHIKCGDGEYYSNDKKGCLALNRFTDTPVNQKWFEEDEAALVRFNRNYTGCGANGVINRFYMPTDAEQNYTYTCTNSNNVDNTNVVIKNLNADLQPDGKADKYVGMTRNLQCDPSSALSNFFLHGEINGRAPPTSISSDGPYTADGTGDDITGNFYTIQCKHIPDLTDCKKMSTAPRSVLHPAGDWWEGQFGIAGHDVNCNIGNENADNKYTLTGWNYVEDGSYSYHIDYNCCRVNQSKV